MAAEQSYVEIRAYEGDEVVKRMGPMSERRAERLEGGVLINLDHDNFYAQIVTSETKLEAV